MFTKTAGTSEWIQALCKRKAQVMLLRQLRPQRLTYDPFTLGYLRDSRRLSGSIRSVICCDTLHLLGGMLSNLIMLNTASQQAASIFANEDFTIREPPDTPYWWIAVHRRRGNRLNALSAWEEEWGHLLGFLLTTMESLWGIRDWGRWRAHSLWVMHCCFFSQLSPAFLLIPFEHV